MDNKGFIFLNIIIGLALIIFLPVHAVDYRLIDIGTLGGSNSFGVSINNNRQVTGKSLVAGDSAIHAFIWDSVNGMQDIHLINTFRSHGSDINNGQIVGEMNFYTGDKRAFIWDATHGMQDIGTLGGNYSEGNGINNRGQLTGYSNNKNDDYRAFLWDSKKGMQDIGTLGTTSRGFAVNDNGQVTGYSYPPGTSAAHAFVWEKGKGMQDIGTLGGTLSFGEDINSNGQVTGSSTTATGEIHAMIWDPKNGMQDLGTLGGSNSWGRGINSSGTVVGGSYTAVSEKHAFVWDPVNGMQDLCAITHCTAKGWEGLYGAIQINDNGDIVGTGIRANGEWHAFIALAPSSSMIHTDIQANDEPNKIDLKSMSVIPVAILSSDTFDAQQDDPDTVSFRPASK